MTDSLSLLRRSLAESRIIKSTQTISQSQSKIARCSSPVRQFSKVLILQSVSQTTFPIGHHSDCSCYRPNSPPLSIHFSSSDFFLNRFSSFICSTECSFQQGLSWILISENRIESGEIKLSETQDAPSSLTPKII